MDFSALEAEGDRQDGNAKFLSWSRGFLPIFTYLPRFGKKYGLEFDLYGSIFDFYGLLWAHNFVSFKLWPFMAFYGCVGTMSVTDEAPGPLCFSIASSFFVGLASNSLCSLPSGPSFICTYLF